LEKYKQAFTLSFNNYYSFISVSVGRSAGKASLTPEEYLEQEKSIIAVLDSPPVQDCIGCLNYANQNLFGLLVMDGLAKQKLQELINE
jgi:hypothetical protein